MVEVMESAPKEATLCEECNHIPSKYKCPGCSIRTCSLLCVKSHKHRTSCTGKKQYNEVVPISQFDDNLLLSDYSMLEEVRRIADSGRRLLLKKPAQFRLPIPLKRLRTAAAKRRINLLFLSSGMSKREKNRTFYNYRTEFISWTIEWKFHSTNVVITDHRVDENKSLYRVIENHLKPGPWKHQLNQFCQEPLDSLQLFIRTNPKGMRSPVLKLDINTPIREQLTNIIILEYPIILVYLPSHTNDFEIINKNTITIPRESKEKEEFVKKTDDDDDDDMFQPGVIFKEEEIEEEEEEDCSLDPIVSDLKESITTFDTNSGFRTTDEIQDSFLTNESSMDMSCEIDEFSGLDVDVVHQDWDDIYHDLMDDISMDGQDLLCGIDEVDLSMKEELEEGEVDE